MQEDRKEQHPSAASTATPAAAYAMRALEQAAHHATEMAIARWSAPVPASEAAGFYARAAWLAQTQQHLQEWLAGGGFRAGAIDMGDTGAALPFPGSRPRLYTQFRRSRSTAD